jgi:hypothetical protein
MTLNIDARSIRTSLSNDGYIAFRGAVPSEFCERILQAIGDELGIWLREPASWDRVSSELDQIPLWGHQSQWNMRQLPELYEIWKTVWGTEHLWVARDSCRFTPPWGPGRARELPLHWDVDPRDRSLQWFPGLIALTDTPTGAGGFRCSPSLMHNRDRWPASWSSSDSGPKYQAGHVLDSEIVEVPLAQGDVLVFDHHLPHGTVLNRSECPRVVFYLQMFPAGTAEEAAANIADHLAGVSPPWWRSKPGHDRAEAGPPATLSAHGRRLLGFDLLS